MKGYLEARHGEHVASEERVGRSLQRVSPVYHLRRQERSANIRNPRAYQADYFGHKLHIDQNEKLAMYGATHVISIDGYSRFITAASTMAVKNNLVIYEEILR
jgi:hypothetical protein